MKKVLFFIAFLFCVGSYALSPVIATCDDNVSITIQKEDVKVADVNIDLQSFELTVDAAEADVKIFSSASLDANSVTTITRFNYIGPILFKTNGIYKKVTKVPGSITSRQFKIKNRNHFVSAGGLSEI